MWFDILLSGIAQVFGAGANAMLSVPPGKPTVKTAPDELEAKYDDTSPEDAAAVALAATAVAVDLAKAPTRAELKAQKALQAEQTKLEKEIKSLEKKIANNNVFIDQYDAEMRKRGEKQRELVGHGLNQTEIKINEATLRMTRYFH